MAKGLALVVFSAAFPAALSRKVHFCCASSQEYEFLRSFFKGPFYQRGLSTFIPYINILSEKLEMIFNSVK